MTRVLDIRLTSSGRFDAIRRLEYVALLLLCVGGGLFLQPYGVFVSGAFLALALMLVPGKQSTLVAREARRSRELNELQSQGLALKARWVAVSQEPLSETTAAERWTIQRDALIWMSVCPERLRAFPEVGGIFKARERKEDVIEDLDSCLVLLSRLRRLASLSENLGLPI